jgi:uncharacterized membrane-anchored protein
MRRKLILICIVAQVLVLGVMAAERELILNTGDRVYLRTAPIDPRDPFRGDFVRLSYEISRVSRDQLKGTLDEDEKQKGDPVYAVLEEGAEGLYNLDYLTDEAPADGIYLRGRVRHGWRPARSRNAVAVKYGIEKFFVEQGTGKDIERRRGTRSGLQVPMEVEIAVGSDGTAVIRDFRWSRLGMSLKMLRVHRRNRAVESQARDQPAERIRRAVDSRRHARALRLSSAYDGLGISGVPAGLRGVPGRGRRSHRARAR